MENYWFSGGVMNFGYINNTLKNTFIIKKPKIYHFENGNSLYVFSKFKKPPKIIKKKNIKIIDDFTETFCKKTVYSKAILQILKEKNIKDVSFCFENAEDYIFLLEDMFKNNIPYSLSDCIGAELAADYFLEKYGQPISIKARIMSGLFVYMGGTPPPCDNNVLRLDFDGNLTGNKIVISEYLIKKTSFPVKISSLGLLDAALKLTGKKTKDIIIKPCIIRQPEE